MRSCMLNQRIQLRTACCFFAVFGCFLSASLAWSLGSDIPDLEPKQYPDKDFRVTRKIYPFSSIKIHLDEVKPKNPSKEHYYCRAWLTVMDGSKTVAQRY